MAPRLVQNFYKTEQYQARGIGFCNTLQRPVFSFQFFGKKRSYVEVLIKFKRNGHTICDPLQICKTYFS